MDSLCPRGCSETEVGARVPPGLEDTSLSQWTGIGRRTVLRPRCGTKALRTDAFADSGRRGLARESVNLDPAIALYDQPSQAYVTYLLSLSLSLGIDIDIDARFCPAIFELEITRPAIYRSNLLLESTRGERGAHAHPTRIENFVSSGRGRYTPRPKLFFSKRCRLAFSRPPPDWTVIFPSPPARSKPSAAGDWIGERKAPGQILFFNIASKCRPTLDFGARGKAFFSLRRSRFLHNNRHDCLMRCMYEMNVGMNGGQRFIPVFST